MAKKGRARSGDSDPGWHSIRMRNIRQFKDSGDIDYSMLTLLFGKNSSGKTTLIRAPLLFKQSLSVDSPTNEATLSGSHVDFGSYKEMVHNGEVTRDVELSAVIDGNWVGWERLVGRFSPEIRELFDEMRVSMTIHWNRRSGQPQYQVIRFSSTNSQLDIIKFDRTGPESFDVHVLNRKPFRIDAPLSFQSIRYAQVTLDSDSGRDSEREVVDFSFALFQLIMGLQQSCDSMIHIGPLREMPRRSYRTEQLPNASAGDSAVAVLRSGEGIKDIERALQSMGMATSIKVEKLAPGFVAVALKDFISGRTNNLADVGFGVSQVLPIVATLATAAPHSTVLIEQPELHLHPEAQGQLADVLHTLAAARQLRLVIETHSEHILLRLQRRIAERKLDTSDVSLFFVDSGSVVRADIDERGQIDRSAVPSGFFEEDWRDLLKLTEAAARAVDEN
ncbi:AAA family ATPase [Nocardia salmonicida]|uniref:AAA family ATPase n=1 Tax=Nocardia salmonicida TaxID=53431 RepID=UPI0033C51B1C